MRSVISLLALVIFPSLLLAQHAGFASADEGVSFDGNDIVSYFDTNGPVKGTASHSYEYHGLKLQFSSKQNLEEFKANPSKYLPAYDGWCAIALTQGSWVRPDFNEYKIQDGRLLFFEVRAFFNGKTAWNKDPDLNKIVADHKFKALQE
ncbi:MAG: YHS domain-containing (seleno)protein [Bacteroidota bacterium]